MEISVRMRSRDGRESHWCVARRVAFAIAVILLGIVYAFAWWAPSVGLFHDDGIYLVTAKAFAEGKGYRIISLPHEIPQTKYPFLFPVALSAIWRVLPDFPRNVPLLKALPLACALLWFGLSYKLLTRLQATPAQALWVVLLTAASPLVVFLSTNLMSESMFALLFTATLLAAHRVEHSQSDGAAWAAGLLAALAFLTRSAGVALLCAVPLAFAVQRRFGAVWRFLLAGGSVASVWPVWVHYAHAHAAAADSTQLYYSSGNYASWSILTNYAMPEKVRILFSNLLVSLASPGVLLGLPTSMWLVLLVVFLLIALCAKNLARADAIHLSVAAYIGVILCWAWQPLRFVVPILPVVLFLLWRAIEAITPNRALRNSVIALVGLVSVFMLANDIKRLPETASSGQFPFGARSADEWSELEKVFSWLRTNTRQDAVVLGNLDPAIYLYTGRQSTRNLVANPYKLFYAPGAPTDTSATSLDEIIGVTKASFLVMTPDWNFVELPVVRRMLARYMERYPEKLEEVDRPDSDPEYRIYRITP